jgi:hypothetical protein
MIAQTSRPMGIQREFDHARKKAKRIRQSWSPEERRKRFLRGREKRAEILRLLVGREDIRGQAG